MKNIANETPMDSLHGRSKWTIEYLKNEGIKDKTILNIGTGFGWFEYNVKDVVKEVYGIEPFEEGLSTAKKYLTEIPNIILNTGSALELPFGDCTFDVVVSWDVIEHIPPNSEEQMVREMCRVLKPNGKIYLTTPHSSIINNITDPAWLLIGHRHYSYSRMKKIFSTISNIEIDDMFTNGGGWTIINILNLYIAKWIFQKKPFFADFFNKKEDSQWEKRNGSNTLVVKAHKKM